MTNGLVSFLTLFFIINQTYSQQPCSVAEYEEFLKEFHPNQNQENIHDFNQRFQKYCSNTMRIKQMNTQTSSYRLGPSSLMDKNQLQIQKILNVGKAQQMNSYQNKEALKKINLNLQSQDEDNHFEVQAAVSVSQSVDYRVSGDVSSIKDQGSCGCCWAFASVGLYQSWMMWKGQNEYDLSQQYVLQCSTSFSQKVLQTKTVNTCENGLETVALGLIKTNGIPNQSQYPYKATVYKTNEGTPSTAGICNEKQRYVYAQNPDATKFNTVYNTTQTILRFMIANFGPVSAPMYATQDFLLYSSGVYDGCPDSFSQSYKLINHAVVIVGYDANGNYIVKNSWGKKWGMNGFGIISKNKNCGITAQVSYLYSDAPAGNGVLIVQYSFSSNFEYRMANQLIFLVLLIIIVNGY